MTRKNINLKEVFEAIITANYSDKDEADQVMRFVDKLADSDKFADLVHQEFNRLKLDERHRLEDKVYNEEDFITQTGFVFRWSGSSYDCYSVDGVKQELFLSELDKRLTLKIIKDINVAYLIKASRESKQLK